MEFTRPLSISSNPGVDIFYMKHRLFELGMLEKEIEGSSKDEYDESMEEAVYSFQERNLDPYNEHLVPTAEIDESTWQSIEREHYISLLPWECKADKGGVISDDQSVGDIFLMPTNIEAKKAERIATGLGGISRARRIIVLEALKYAYDPDVPTHFPISLYIRGANLYDKYDQTTPNIITLDRIQEGAVRQPHFFPDQKSKLMRETVTLFKNVLGADSSGAIIGLCHFAKVCKPGTDVTANVLSTDRYSTLIEDDAHLIPGDWVCKKNHIGLYVGGGYIVEWIGGAYGCQLTSINPDDKRIAYNFITNEFAELASWESYRRPKWY